MNIESIREKLQAVVGKASLISDEWEGKEDEMPSEVADEISNLVAEATDLTEKLKVAMKLEEQSAFLTEGLGTKAAIQGMAVDAPLSQGTMGFKSLGEQLQSIAKSSGRGYMDPRLVEMKQTGMSEGVPADGGFLVQEDFASEMLKLVFAEGEIMSRVKRMPISANSNSLRANYLDEGSRADGSRWGGVLAYWKAEGATKVASNPTFGQILLELNKLIGLCYATDELLQDAVALESIISWAFQMEFTYQVEAAIINGTGAGQPLGIVNAPAFIAIAEEVGQPADTIVSENIVNMWSRMFAPLRKNGVWLINQDCEPQLHSMYVAVGATGVPVYLPAGGLSGAPYATLYGRPVIPVEHCQTVGTVGDIIFADLSQYWLIDKGTMQKATSIHVQFVTDETCFRFVYRVDGQPSWPGTLTPANSAVTLSPFIGIESR